MNSNKKKLLIIAFTFPPSASIGGRRWAYLAKELNKNNDIKVITSDFKEEKENCPWGEVIDSYKNNIYYLKHQTPFHRLNIKPKNILGKLRYRYSLYLGKKKNPYAVYDRSLYFAHDSYLKAKELITKNKIQNILVTGGPFYLVYVTSQLKIDFGNKINFIVDLRDPWTENYRTKELTDTYLKQQRLQNEIVFKRMDRLFVPYKVMQKNILNIWPNIKNKISILPHGFDEDLFKNKSFENNNLNKWYYAGTSYSDMELEYQIIEDLLIKTNSELSFYSFTQPKYNIIECKNFKYKGLKTQNEILNETSGFGVALLLTPNFNKDFKTSKFFELLRTGKFLLYIGLKGVVSDFVKENKIGYVIETNTDKKLNDKQIEEFKEAYTNYSPKPELYENYSFEHLTKIIENQL